ncbi:TnpV protein [Faecalibacterium sp. An121]|uniref:TnpV protein n=1 Tax=Faecalibacterium sp. An121 TaxID=1965550 RepID=UPI00406C979B
MAPPQTPCPSSWRMQRDSWQTPTGPIIDRRSAASLQIPCWRSTMNSTEGLPSNGPSPLAPHLPSCPGAATPPKTTLELRRSETFMSSTRRPPWPPWAPPSERAAARCCCRSQRCSGRWNATSQKKGDFGMSSTALQYTQNGDYLVPNIELNQPQTPLGKYGRMRKTYLKENRPILYNHLLLSGKLYPHLAEIDRTAKDRLDRQMEELLKQNPAPDKAAQQMAWVQHMNALKMQAEEAIRNELIFN